MLCLRHKVRSPRTSQLSSCESFRFQRAVYRIWIFASAFPVAKDDRGYNPETVSEILKERKAHLAKLETQEVLEIERVSKFLVSVYRSSLAAGSGVFQTAES